MDPTKAPCAALTMVYRDHDILRRWVGYYEKHFGREHLYVISHGGDPDHARIAEGCNVVNIPRDPTMHRFDSRRWNFLNNFHAGLMRYYNWMIVSDVDEFVLLDPDIGNSLTDYLAHYDPSDSGKRKDRPNSLSPFGIELIHNPKVEPDPIDPEVPILSRRKVFRANANYAKPCVLRKPTQFTAGGHANTHQPRVLDPHLFLLHVRFYDYEASKARLLARRTMKSVDDAAEDSAAAKHGWTKDLDTFTRLSEGTPVREDCELTDFRRKMIEDQQHLHDGKITFFGGGRTKELYSLPARFATLV
jgi:hypothetical protein